MSDTSLKTDNAWVLQTLCLDAPAQRYSTAQREWEKAKRPLLEQKMRSWVATALHQHSRFSDAKTFAEECGFLLDYVLSWAFGELFSPDFRAQRLLRGVSVEHRAQAQSLGLHYLLAERYLAEKTPQAKRAAQKQARIEEAIHLAAQWRGGPKQEVLPSTHPSIPHDIALTSILQRLWLYRCREVLKAWGRQQQSAPKHNSFDQSPALASSTRWDTASPHAPSPSHTPPSFETSDTGELWRSVEELVPYLVRDPIDQMIWRDKSKGYSEKKIAEKLNTAQEDDAHTPAQPWTRGKIAGRWNALARRLRTMVQLLDMIDGQPQERKLFNALKEADCKHWQIPASDPEYFQLPLESRELWGPIRQAKNPAIFEIMQRFWLCTQTFQHIRWSMDEGVGWDHIVQYWLLANQQFKASDPASRAHLQYWFILRDLPPQTGARHDTDTKCS